jgi:hypothetical protein
LQLAGFRFSRALKPPFVSLLEWIVAASMLACGFCRVGVLAQRALPFSKFEDFRTAIASFRTAMFSDLPSYEMSLKQLLRITRPWLV